MAATMFDFDAFSYARSQGKEPIPFTAIPFMAKEVIACSAEYVHNDDPGGYERADWIVLFTHNYTGEQTAYLVYDLCSRCLIEIQDINRDGQ